MMPWLRPNMTGIQIFCAGLSSDLIKPTERGTTLDVRQRIKRMPNMMEEVVIVQSYKLRDLKQRRFIFQRSIKHDVFIFVFSHQLT